MLRGPDSIFSEFVRRGFVFPGSFIWSIAACIAPLRMDARTAFNRHCHLETNIMKTRVITLGAFAFLCGYGALHAGSYSAAFGDPTNPRDAPVPGFVGPHGEGKARLLQSGGTYQNPDNYVNPLFFGWADGYQNYLPAPGVAGTWQQPAQTLGPVTGDNFHIVSLGDLNATQIANGDQPGAITLTFSEPIRNKSGADFVAFENGAISAGGAGVAGQIFAELGYVEVSSDGVQFARMPSVSLTTAPVSTYGTVDATNVFGLVGKHANAYGDSWGTPFDLDWLAAHPLVTGGQVNLDAITHIRIVDIPGEGSSKDSTNNPIYDAWVTFGSGGIDLEAIGVISREMDFETWQDQRGLTGSQRGEMQDPDGDCIPNLLEYAAALLPTTPDSADKLQHVSYDAGQLTLHLRRDERAVDLTYEVEVSNDLQSWETIARSVGGMPFVGVAPHVPQIIEASASHIASVGVVREVSVTDVVSHAAKQFMRVRVIRQP